MSFVRLRELVTFDLHDTRHVLLQSKNIFELGAIIRHFDLSSIGIYWL